MLLGRAGSVVEVRVEKARQEIDLALKLNDCDHERCGGLEGALCLIHRTFTGEKLVDGFGRRSGVIGSRDLRRPKVDLRHDGTLAERAA